MAIGSPRPAAIVTSSKVPSPLFRKQREPHRVLPGAAQEQDVEVAVVVEIGAGDVEGVDLVGEAGRGRPILERAVAAVDEQRGTQVGVERGGEKVGQAVAVEVVEDAAAGQVRARGRQADLRRHVLEPAHVELGLKRVERNQVFRRDLVGILAQRHVGEVQQPADAEVAWPLLQVRGEPFDRLARAGLLGVNGLARDRKDAARGADASDAVVDLAPPQRGDAQQSHQVSPHPRRNARGAADLQRLLKRGGGLGETTFIHLDQASLIKEPACRSQLLRGCLGTDAEMVALGPQHREPDSPPRLNRLAQFAE